jgi:hypothetical protein
MKRTIIVSIVSGFFGSALLLILLSATGIVVGARSAGQLSQTPAAQIVNAPAAAVGSGFTYQGHLNFGGNAVSATCGMTFTLYNNSAGGSVIGTPINNAAVSVNSGNFTRLLDFGASAFTGDARWLEIKVNCNGNAATLSRQALTAAPYALSLMPGAVISGSTTGATLNVTRTNGGLGLNVCCGIRSAGIGGSAIYGFTYDAYTGVYGESNLGAGVVGLSNSGYAMAAAGDAHQSRVNGGWVKAMVIVYYGQTNNMLQCYNSQQSSQIPNSTPPCGFTITRTSGGNPLGDYTIDFGFEVDDRFISITPYYGSGKGIIPVVVSYPTVNQVRIQTFSSFTSTIDSAFFIQIY